MGTMIKEEAHTAAHKTPRWLSILLWVLQVLLALLFLWHGLLMAMPPAEMVAMIDESMGAGLRMFIGVAEILAAIGLILPALTRIVPVLTPLAAAGLMIVMGCAAGFHAIRGETSSAISAAVIFLLVTLVAYLRWKVAPIMSRSSMRPADKASALEA